MSRIEVRGACPHDCPDTCAWIATVDDGVVTGVHGDPAHPITAGHLCVKGRFGFEFVNERPPKRDRTGR